MISYFFLYHAFDTCLNLRHLSRNFRDVHRLFEEENKASGNEKAANRIQTQKTGMTLQFQQWPTTQYDSILILSEDED
jgi:hypothetical protein